MTKESGSKAFYVSLHSPGKYELKKCKKSCSSNLIFLKKKCLRSPKYSNEKNTLIQITKENHCSPPGYVLYSREIEKRMLTGKG